MYHYKKNSRLGLTLEDLKNENRNVSFSSNEYPSFPGYVKYRTTEPPVINRGQRLVEVEPLLYPTETVQAWEVIDLKGAELKTAISEYKIELKEKATQKRQDLEYGGTTVMGFPVYTDSQSQAKVMSVFILASQNPALIINWKGSDNNFHTLNAQAITALAYAVLGHVQNVFNIEKALSDRINDATTIAELEAIDEDITNW